MRLFPTGDDFKERARTYLLEAFKKGVPSIFTDVKSLYKDPAKAKALQEIVEDLKSTYASSSSHPNGINGNGSAQPAPSAETETEPVSTYLHILYYLAQLHSFLRRLPTALSLIDEAIAHTPTLPELYTCKARILKRAGDLVGAVGCVEDARSLDGADRFLNTKSAKYHLRAGMEGEAGVILGMFTKVGDFWFGLVWMRRGMLTMECFSLITTERRAFARIRPRRDAIPALPHRSGRMLQACREAWARSEEIPRNPQSQF